MLPREHRLVRSAEFAAAVRRGTRAGDGTLVVHLASAGSDRSDDPARVGFVVSRAVGAAVVRNRVKRRLRSVVGADLTRLPAGDLVVVRALPPSATSTHAELSASFDRCLRTVQSRRAAAGSVEAS